MARQPMSRAAEAARPVDLGDGRVGARLRLGDGLATRGDVEHAAAVGQKAVAVAPGAGVEDLHALDARPRLRAP